jgi:hypothetical protein
VTGRRLNVAAQVAQRLPDAHLAQMQAQIDDPDNRCGLCGELIDGPVAEVILLTDANYTAARLAHPACARSGIYEQPGLRVAEAERLADGVNLTVVLGRRPRPMLCALVFIELLDAVSFVAPGSTSFIDEDPVADYADVLGLQPISGTIEQITPPLTTTSRLQLTDDRLTLHHPRGEDLIWDKADDTLAGWTQTASQDDGTALVITARGLGLSQQPPLIAQALATQPAWGAQVIVKGLPHRRRWRSPR